MVDTLRAADAEPDDHLGRTDRRVDVGADGCEKLGAPVWPGGGGGMADRVRSVEEIVEPGVGAGGVHATSSSCSGVDHSAAPLRWWSAQPHAGWVWVALGDAELLEGRRSP